MAIEDELRKFEPTYSIERLKAFIYSPDDKIEDIFIRYKNNLKISQALYPELCTLEVILRNAIDYIFRMHISATWLEDEIKHNVLLDSFDYLLLMNTYKITKKECESSLKDVTSGKIIANLNFGFWTNLCTKKYSAKIWNKLYCFRGVFVNYPNNKPEIAVISKKLYTIRKLRNRIFHYEQIFKYPQKTLQIYNNILEILSYLPNDEFKIISKNSNFLPLYNTVTKNLSNK